MSLSSTYLSRKKLIADNLNIMDVPDAQASEGLTTLANKILNIPRFVNVVSFTVNGNVDIPDFNPVYTSDNLIVLYGDDSYDDYTTGGLSHNYSDGESLHTVYVIGGLTGLGADCFKGCTGLETVTIPASINSIGTDCFKDCNINDYELYWTGEDILEYDSSKMPAGASTIFTIPVGETENYIAAGYPADKLVERKPGYNYDINISKKYIVRDETTEISVTVTDENDNPIIGESVSVNIGDDTFTDITDNNGQVNITYNGLGTVGKVIVNCESETDVFYDGGVLVKRSVENITLGDGDGSTPWLVSNGDVVIDWGDGTRDTVNNPTTSLSHAYSQSDSDYITLIGDITHLGDSCFNYCESIEKVTIPASVTSIGNYCFYSCYSLLDVVFSDNITNIGAQCFRYCSNIKDIIIPDGVTEISDYCFNNCSGLRSVSIPSSVTSISDFCFDGCFSLENYELYWTHHDIYPYNLDKMPTETSTIFTIPTGETTNYTNKGYPTDKIQERS